VGAVILPTIMRSLTDSLESVPGYLVRQAIEAARAQGSNRQADHERLTLPPST
jgi:ABC-type molybdate transport system permease subunit